MKKLLFITILCGLTVAAYAQSDVMTATLQHGNETTVFKSANALVQAYAAAVDGDVITLSDGNFAPVSISKSIKIYGAGFEADPETGTAITQINGAFDIGVADATLADVHLEGLLVNGQIYGATVSPGSTTAQLQNCVIKKCRMTNLSFNSNIENVSVEQCYIVNNISANDQVVATTLMIANCYIGGQIKTFNTQSTILVNHSIICGETSGGANCAYTYTNSILAMNVPWSYSTVCGENCVLRNCIVLGQKYGAGTITENIYVVAINNVFADGTNAAYSAERTWELTQPDVWVGTDGTPIGPTGGLTWNKVPGTPVVKNLQLNVDGNTLKVNYEAEVR